MSESISKRNAFTFVILLGMVSLFADMVYEGAFSISGQYLGLLGATGTVVGVVAGLGELIGFGFKFASCSISDRIGKYWLITFIGYFLNLLAIPLLALAGNWPLAASLMVLTRLGKALRTPSKDAMLFNATETTGHGWEYGLHEIMDHTGAIIGPLLVSYMLYFRGTFQTSFALLLIPALCALSMLALARMLYPHPQDLEIPTIEVEKKGFTKKYWLYAAAFSCIGAGYVDFPLIAFHFYKTGIIPEVWVPVYFSIAMAAAGLSALICSRLYDKIGKAVLISVTAIACLFAPLVFMEGFYFPLIGMILWGIGIGSQEPIMRAVVAKMMHMDKRSTAYGILNIWFGVFWFLGSALMGYLYDTSLISLIAFSLAMQLAAIPMLLTVKAVK